MILNSVGRGVAGILLVTFPLNLYASDDAIVIEACRSIVPDKRESIEYTPSKQDRYFSESINSNVSDVVEVGLALVAEPRRPWWSSSPSGYGSVPNFTSLEELGVAVALALTVGVALLGVWAGVNGVKYVHRKIKQYRDPKSTLPFENMGGITGKKQDRLTRRCLHAMCESDEAAVISDSKFSASRSRLTPGIRGFHVRKLICMKKESNTGNSPHVTHPGVSDRYEVRPIQTAPFSGNPFRLGDGSPGKPNSLSDSADR